MKNQKNENDNEKKEEKWGKERQREANINSKNQLRVGNLKAAGRKENAKKSEKGKQKTRPNDLDF